MYLLRPNYPKLKTTLQLAIFKVKLLQRKISEQNAKTKREVATLILKGKIPRARFKVELIISENDYIDALETVEIYCNLLLEQFHLIQGQKEIDDSLKEAISTIIWVSSRLTDDVQELTVLANILCGKYGPDFSKQCKEGTHEAINTNIKRKLGVYIPSKLLIENYMAEIAANYNISYIPDPRVTGKDSEEEILIPETQSRHFDFSIKKGSDYAAAYPSTSSPFSSFLLPEVAEERTAVVHTVSVLNQLQESHKDGKTPDLKDKDKEKHKHVPHNKEKHKHLPTDKEKHKNLPTDKEKHKNLQIDKEKYKDLSSAKEYDLPKVPTEQQNDLLEGKSLSPENCGIRNIPKEQACGLPNLSPVTVKRIRSSSDDLLTTFEHTDKEKDNVVQKQDTQQSTRMSTPDNNKNTIHKTTTNQNPLNTETSKRVNFINTIFPPLSLTKQSLKLSMSASNIFQRCSNTCESLKEPDMYRTTPIQAIKSKFNEHQLTNIINLYNQNTDVLELPCTSKDTSLLLLQNVPNAETGPFQTLTEDVDMSLPTTSAYVLDDSLDELLNLPDVPDDEIYILPQLPSVPDVDINKIHDNNKDIDFDELCKRFYALKRKDK
uniref:IST1 homolog n=1 Tax=Diabrotica virgifera virgifera TaxID=50390 RepID=A0A6P7G8Y0_DIAVI